MSENNMSENNICENNSSLYQTSCGAQKCLIQL